MPRPEAATLPGQPRPGRRPHVPQRSHLSEAPERMLRLCWRSEFRRHVIEKKTNAFSPYTKSHPPPSIGP